MKKVDIKDLAVKATRVPAREMKKGEMYLSVQFIPANNPNYTGPYAIAHVTFPFGSANLAVFNNENGLSISRNMEYTKTWLNEDVISAILDEVERMEEERLEVDIGVKFSKPFQTPGKVKGSMTVYTPYGKIGNINFGWNGEQVLLFDPSIYVKPTVEGEEGFNRDGGFKMNASLREFLIQEAYNYMVENKILVQSTAVEAVGEEETEVETESISV